MSCNKAHLKVSFCWFKSKQEILDCIVEECMKRFQEKRAEVNLETIRWTDVEKICLDMFLYQTTDEWITHFRQLLLIEQFKNPKMKEIYQQVFIDDPIKSMSNIFSQLIQLGYMKEGTPEVYAMELYGPFFMYHTVGGESESILKNLREHVTRFRRNVVTDLRLLEEEKLMDIQCASYERLIPKNCLLDYCVGYMDCGE